MLLATVVALALAADQPVGAAVVVSRRTNISSAEAHTVALQVSALLRELEVPLTLDADAAATRLAKLGVPDPAACAGRMLCIAELGTQLKVAWVLAVSASQVDTDRSLAFELIRVADQSVVERDTVIQPAKTKLTTALIEAFAMRCRAALAADAPVATSLVPEPPPAPPLVVAQEQPRHTGSFVLGGAAVLALGAAAALLAVGLSTRAELSAGKTVDGVTRSDLPGSTARQKNDAANLELGLAAAAAGVGVGLGTAAVLTW